MSVLIAETKNSPAAPPQLVDAAFRLQRRLHDQQIVVSFETAFYQLRKHDRTRVFRR